MIIIIWKDSAWSPLAFWLLHSFWLREFPTYLKWIFLPQILIFLCFSYSSFSKFNCMKQAVSWNEIVMHFKANGTQSLLPVKSQIQHFCLNKKHALNVRHPGVRPLMKYQDWPMEAALCKPRCNTNRRHYWLRRVNAAYIDTTLFNNLL